ncbi:FEKKY domain-containing protein [Chryseobacterium oryctis]|uniref:Uncharacterized protein n=1 Tax=Chryseobacterium oryctis TaxID=2952618 RepID=A0ABT3HK79_9FLAO|nr:hypothetical protein [Chryseobacterium oryctis]MCW3160184.1 hypothetical protein [Chryseobacterium oryctis]
MKTSKSLFLTIALSFSATILAQKNDEIKITIKDSKGKKVQTIEKKENLPHFIQFGIMSKNHESFKNKYKVDVVYQNCVISPFISQQAKENNLAVAKLLDEKYGDIWKKDLEITPYGL